MNLKKLININFWRFDHKHYKDLYDYDIRFKIGRASCRERV